MRHLQLSAGGPSGAGRQRGIGIIGFVVGLAVGVGIALLVAVYINKIPTPFMDKKAVLTAEQQAAEAEKNRNWDPNATLLGSGQPPAAPAAVAPPPVAQVNTAAPAAGQMGQTGQMGQQQPATAAPQSPDTTAQAAQQAQQQAQERARQEAQRQAELAAQEAERNRLQNSNQNVAKTAEDDPLISQLLLATRQSGARPDVAAASLNHVQGEGSFVYYVQAGAFRSSADAGNQQTRLALMGLQANITERDQAGRPVYRVRLGPFGSKAEADRAKASLEANGMDAALVRVQR